VLQAFLEQESWGVTAMAGRLGIARSAAHRLMETLRAGGLLRQDRPGGPYRLGLLLAALGERAACDRPDFVGLARPVLQRLVAETGETASLCVVQAARGLCVASVDSQQSRRFTIGPSLRWGRSRASRRTRQPRPRRCVPNSRASAPPTLPSATTRSRPAHAPSARRLSADLGWTRAILPQPVQEPAHAAE
jgi:hypothetical protein